jgi:hypothetical protein
MCRSLAAARLNAELPSGKALTTRRRRAGASYLEPRGVVEIKGKNPMEIFFLRGRR